MKVALVHDDIFQWGGAERVLLCLSEIYPDAPIYTSVYDQDNPLIAQHFANKRIITSSIQKIPGWKSIYRQLLPLYPIVFEQFDFTQYDLVITHTTRFAKSVITKPGTIHICYSHSPPRFLWNFSDVNYIGFCNPLFSWLRIVDRVSSYRPDGWIAGSANAQKRIKKIYKQNAKIVYPFVDPDGFDGTGAFEGRYMLIIARLNKYKKVDLAIRVANRLKLPLKVVGDGPEMEYLEAISGPTVDLVGNISEVSLKFLIAGCKCLLVCAEEDFGLTALEAQALGKPVVAFKKGGNLETVIDAQTGYLFEQQSEDSLIKALRQLEKNGYNKDACLANARHFSKEQFVSNFTKSINSFLT